MKRHFLQGSFLLFLIATGSGLWAQIPNGYYNNANGKTGNELKTALHEIIKGHTTVYYSNIWNAFWSTDNKGNGVVWDMYSDIPNGTPPYTFSMGQNQCGEYTQEGDCYNREHSWPQSWFSGDDQATPTRDLHHVFPTDGFVNSKRSNYPYGEVQSASWTSQNGSKLGTCKSSLGYDGIVFEPIDEYKGDFARALMYMSVRYYTEDDNWSTSGMTNKSEILPWAIQMLLSWNDNDPVSQKEIDRNNVIYSDYQHNRNPFIDHPEYARMIWDPNWHEPAGCFVKVTSTDDLTDGNYLIVCESNNVAFDGGLTTLDATGNTIEVAISGNSIESNTTTDAAAFTITAKSGGYSIRSASGYYIGNTSDANALKTSQTDTYVNTISITNGNADIVSSSSHLRYNSATNQTRFRYFKSSTYTSQPPIQLYKKAETYSITLATVEHGSISANAEEASEGTPITLTATPDEGYELDYWTVTDAQNNAIAVIENQFVMPASNVTVSAAFVYVGQPFEQKYYLVTSTDQLVSGRTYLIVNTAAGKALGTTQNTNNRAAVDVAIGNNVIESIGGTVCELTLEGSTGAWTFFDANWGSNGGYLYAASSSNNQLKTQASNNANGQWNISFDNDGMASVVAQGSNTRNNLRYNPNNGSPVFNCYASTSNMASVQLFIRSEQYKHNENTTLACLNTFDKHTVRSGATLTANKVLGMNLLNDENYLVIEDGAQLIHNSEGVKATVKKGISAYSTQSGTNNGWHLIGYSFAGNGAVAEMTNLTANDYDLYHYDEPTHYWMNQEFAANNFTVLKPAKGYLYANSQAQTIGLKGTLEAGNATVPLPLSYTDGIDLAGFNLVGNPFAHNVTAFTGNNVADEVYRMNGTKDDLTVSTIDANHPLLPGEGFFVKATADDASITFNSGAKGETAKTGRINLELRENGKLIDRLIVKQTGNPLEKFTLRENGTKIYATEDAQDYAVIVIGTDGVHTVSTTDVPVNFNAAKNGTCRLNVNIENMDLEYLHLIDNLTGADIDLLQTPEYVFNALTSDYASRFRLVFGANDEGGASTGSATFAFVSNGEIVINGATDNATLQIIDVMGRVIVSRDAVRHISTSGIPAGVYVLRLIDGDGVRIQKIVID